jgi:ornithine cyclodeaminase/alanine dehydrogenase-like protein (mu-crystallin family)
MPILLTRSDLRPLFEQPEWIDESLDVIAQALARPTSGQFSWLHFPLAQPDTWINVQLETAPNDGTYLRAYLDRATHAAASQPALLFAPEEGKLLALMNLEDLNPWRTAAPVGLAARHLAPDTATSLAIIGSGAQARYHLRVLRQAVPGIRTLRVYSGTREYRERFATEAAATGGLDASAVSSPQEAVEEAQIVCVTARGATVAASWVRPGALVTSILPGCVDEMLPARLIVPAIAGPQARPSGWNPRHGVPRPAAGREPADVDAELADVIAGRAPARTRPDETVLYEQRGMFGWDTALLSWAYRRACQLDRGTPITLD